jgi:hypothetical protein
MQSLIDSIAAGMIEEDQFTSRVDGPKTGVADLDTIIASQLRVQPIVRRSATGAEKGACNLVAPASLWMPFILQRAEPPRALENHKVMTCPLWPPMTRFPWKIREPLPPPSRAQAV